MFSDWYILLSVVFVLRCHNQLQSFVAVFLFTYFRFVRNFRFSKRIDKFIEQNNQKGEELLPVTPRKRQKESEKYPKLLIKGFTTAAAGSVWAPTEVCARNQWGVGNSHQITHKYKQQEAKPLYTENNCQPYSWLWSFYNKTNFKKRHFHYRPYRDELHTF